jgi:tagatose 1,6-diphosphate aldolase GatY/KbaY
MSYVTTKEILLQAQQGKYAVGAFNVENMEMAQAVIEAAVELSAPVILQTTPSTLRYAPVEMYSAIVTQLAKEAAVPVALHLDHGSSFNLAKRALEAGYSSVMIDGSKEIFDQNIQLTRQVVETAQKYHVPVEAELGKVGGKEDDLEAEGDAYTDPEQARIFVEQTGVDSLAVAIGTAHGVYRGEPKLDVGRLREIQAVVDIPLVLHGASGLSDESVKECIQAGICKVNFATELRIAYSDGIKETLADIPETYDPKAYGNNGRERVKNLVKDRMMTCGCQGKGIMV